MVYALPVVPVQSLPPAGIARVDRVSPRSVRISVTDRCDMACIYCRPSRTDGYLPAQDRLNVDEWERLVSGLVAAGIRRVRITGGEPLLFSGLLEVVERIRRLGVDDLAMTTNASQLARLAAPLRRAGLARLNISIDSLDADRFARMTRGGRLSDVMAGIDEALRCGFDEIKTNTVVVRGENEDELRAIVSWAWSLRMTPRFLELMGVGEGAKIFRERGVSYREMRATLEPMLQPVRGIADADRGPAKYVRSLDGAHRVGFITGTTETFCGDCDRLRATSDGVLRACLSRNDGVDVSGVLAAPAANAAIAHKLGEAWSMKPDATWKGCTERTAAAVSMRATGG